MKNAVWENSEGTFVCGARKVGLRKWSQNFMILTQVFELRERTVWLYDCRILPTHGPRTSTGIAAHCMASWHHLSHLGKGIPKNQSLE